MELSVGQVNRDHNTTSQRTLAYMLFQQRFHVQASCVTPYKRLARLSMPGLHNKRIVQALGSTPGPNKYGSSLSGAGNKKTEGNSGKKFKGGIKIHLSHVGGINAHSSVGKSKEPEGGERINLVTRRGREKSSLLTSMA